MKTFLCCGMVLIGLLLAGNAFADGNRLLEQCTNAVNYADGARKIDYEKLGFCLGFMQGLTNMNQLYEVSLDRKNVLFCTPREVTNGQLARVVVKYLKEHPEDLHLHEATLAIAAFVEAFPCK